MQILVGVLGEEGLTVEVDIQSDETVATVVSRVALQLGTNFANMIRVFKSVKALDKRAFVESYMGVKMENVRMDEAVNTRVNDPRRIAFIVDVPVRATSRIRLLYTKERRFLRLAKIIEGWDAVVLEMTSLCTIFAVFDTQEEASFQEGTAILGVARLLVAVLKVLLEWLGEGILPRSAYDNL